MVKTIIHLSDSWYVFHLNGNGSYSSPDNEIENIQKFKGQVKDDADLRSICSQRFAEAFYYANR